jgi:voltage-gated sodium channel
MVREVDPKNPPVPTQWAQVGVSADLRAAAQAELRGETDTGGGTGASEDTDGPEQGLAKPEAEDLEITSPVGPVRVSESRNGPITRSTSEKSCGRRTSQASLLGFKDPDDIKKQVRESLLKPKAYNVFNFYYETGICQRIAKHYVFENATLAVIALNAIYIAVDTDWNKDDPLKPEPTKSLLESGPFFQFMEHFFCVYFTAEILIRFLSFEVKTNCFKDGWFVFDSCLVFLMVVETWVMTIIEVAVGSSGSGGPLSDTGMLRLLRLLRLSRLMRMLRSLPELMILVKGMVQAMASVGYVFALLSIVTYVFAIAFTILSVGTPTVNEKFFGNVALSMYSLLIYATFLDNLSLFLDALLEEYPPLLLLAYPFICLSALTIMNMLIGVLCEVVQGVATTEKEEMQTTLVREKMKAVATELDQNNNGRISYAEFVKIVEDKNALNALMQVDVNPEGLPHFAELFFFDEEGLLKELEFDEFMEMVLDLREGNQATVKDVLRLWMQVKLKVNTKIAEMHQEVDAVEKRIDAWTKQVEFRLAGLMTELRKLDK